MAESILKTEIIRLMEEVPTSALDTNPEYAQSIIEKMEGIIAYICEVYPEEEHIPSTKAIVDYIESWYGLEEEESEDFWDDFISLLCE